MNDAATRLEDVEEVLGRDRKNPSISRWGDWPIT